jgi:DNA-binding NarL/FixJ family response regulator
MVALISKKQQTERTVLEIDLPNANGVGTLRQLRSHFPELKVLVVSCQRIYAISAI